MVTSFEERELAVMEKLIPLAGRLSEVIDEADPCLLDCLEVFVAHIKEGRVRDVTILLETAVIISRAMRDKRMWTCVYCGGKFSRVRKTKLYCGNKCRVAHHRNRGAS